jgi:CHRD domain-containing protein
MRIALALSLAVVIASAASGQTQYRADLNGASVVPSVSTSAGGYAKFTLNSDSTVTYFVTTWLLSGTAANISTGAAGVNGPVLFSLSGGPTTWSGQTPALGATDIANLRASGLYVDVDTAANPGGEIRGQIVPRPILFGTHLTGDQETPKNKSTAMGDATFQVNSNGTITYNVTVSGLTGTAAHIHTGAFGVSGPITFSLSGGPTNWSGTTAAMSAAQFDALQADGMYVNVHTIAFPGGEIRGQIVPTEIPYGFGSASSAGVPAFHASGGAIRGGMVTLQVMGGLPNGGGLLIISLTDGAGAVKVTPYLLGAPLLILPVGLDGLGNFSSSGTVPDLAGSTQIFLQFFGFETGGPSGNVYSSNGLELPIFDY